MRHVTEIDKEDFAFPFSLIVADKDRAAVHPDRIPLQVVVEPLHLVPDVADGLDIKRPFQSPTVKHLPDDLALDGDAVVLDEVFDVEVLRVALVHKVESLDVQVVFLRM